MPVFSSVTGYPCEVTESSTGSRVHVSVVLPIAASNSALDDKVERNVKVSKLFFGRFWRFEASGCSVLTSVQCSVLRGAMLQYPVSLFRGVICQVRRRSSLALRCRSVPGRERSGVKTYVD